MPNDDFATPLAAAYTGRLAAPTPTPGGGSASAVAGALAASLLQMAAGISLEKATDEQRPELERGVEIAQRLRERFLRLGSDDEAVYGRYLEAIRLSRITPEERAIRKEAIELATINAATVPLNIAETALTVLQVIPDISRVANPNLLSDLATAAHIVFGAGNGALVMVKVNLESIKTEDAARDIRERYDHLSFILQLALSEALTLVAASDEPEDYLPF